MFIIGLSQIIVGGMKFMIEMIGLVLVMIRQLQVLPLVLVKVM